MLLDECFELGHIVKPHGTKGEVQVILDTDHPENYFKMESVFVVHDKTPVPFFISGIRSGGKGMVIKFDDVDSIEQANELRNARLFLPLNQLPALNENQFYYHDILGFKVIDQSIGELGTVKEFYLKGSQDLIIMLYKDRNVLIPVSDDIVVKADMEKKNLLVNLPHGLLDVYLS